MAGIYQCVKRRKKGVEASKREERERDTHTHTHTHGNLGNTRAKDRRDVKKAAAGRIERDHSLIEGGGKREDGLSWKGRLIHRSRSFVRSFQRSSRPS